MKTALQAIGALLLAATAATAQTPAPMTVGALISAIESRGYSVFEVDAEGAWFEVEATNPEGVVVDLIVDATTAEIIREGADD